MKNLIILCALVSFYTKSAPEILGFEVGKSIVELMEKDSETEGEVLERLRIFFGAEASAVEVFQNSYPCTIESMKLYYPSNELLHFDLRKYSMPGDNKSLADFFSSNGKDLTKKFEEMYMDRKRIFCNFNQIQKIEGLSSNIPDSAIKNISSLELAFITSDMKITYVSLEQKTKNFNKEQLRKVGSALKKKWELPVDLGEGNPFFVNVKKDSDSDSKGFVCYASFKRQGPSIKSTCKTQIPSYARVGISTLGDDYPDFIEYLKSEYATYLEKSSNTDIIL